jgi:hypothetical protein
MRSANNVGNAGHVAETVNKILNRNGFGEGNDTNQGRRVFFILFIFWGLFTRKDHLPSPNPFLFRILFTVPATWQCVDPKNVVVPEALRRSSAGQTGD